MIRNVIKSNNQNVIKTITGEDSESVLSTGELTALVGCSRRKIVNTRRQLRTIGPITRERRYKPGHPQPICGSEMLPGA